MKALRTAVGLAGALLLGGGYFAGQWSYFANDTAAYVARLDGSPVPLASLAILFSAVILCLVPDKAVER